jgi:thymidylate synthase ThyX
MQLRYPKFIHGEFMTHRVFSRNASSSRAIPVERLIEDVIRDPAVPMFWGKNQKGMQAAEELDDTEPKYVGYDGALITERESAKNRWLRAQSLVLTEVRNLIKLGVHKQIVNRLIEPWCHINVVCSSTEWANFDALRCHPDAQPEMRALAEAMAAARMTNTPRLVHPGSWHVPYVALDENVGTVETAIKLSVARCARVSYLTHEGKPPNVEDDLKLYDRLVGSVPLHASPAEHQATPDTYNDYGNEIGPWYKMEEWGNFVGWRQYRKMLPNERVKDR